MYVCMYVYVCVPVLCGRMGDTPGRPMAVPMLAGACAGVVSRLVCHPIDTIKSKVQVEVAAERASWSSVIYLNTHTHTHTHTHTYTHTHTHAHTHTRTHTHR